MALNNLIKHLKNSSLKNCLPFLKNINFSDINYNFNNIPYNEKNYRKMLIYQNNEFDIYLIDWNNLSSSYIHNHPPNGCIFKVLKGEIKEELYNKQLHLIKSTVYNKNSGYIDDTMGLHKMTNLSNENSLSLHIYSPPNFKMLNFKKN